MGFWILANIPENNVAQDLPNHLNQFVKCQGRAGGGRKKEGLKKLSSLFFLYTALNIYHLHLFMKKYENYMYDSISVHVAFYDFFQNIHLSFFRGFY
mgnify:CR=1 FL=1